MMNFAILRFKWATTYQRLILRANIHMAAFLLIAMFSLFLIKALRHFDDYQIKFLLQLFSEQPARVLSYAVPVSLGIAILLLFEPRLRLFGFYYSLALLGIFSAYIGLALMMPPSIRPCSCISAIKGISWQNQLKFNLDFLLIAFIGIILKRWNPQQQKERASPSRRLSTRMEWKRTGFKRVVGHPIYSPKTTAK